MTHYPRPKHVRQAVLGLTHLAICASPFSTAEELHANLLGDDEGAELAPDLTEVLSAIYVHRKRGEVFAVHDSAPDGQPITRYVLRKGLRAPTPREARPQ